MPGKRPSADPDDGDEVRKRARSQSPNESENDEMSDDFSMGDEDDEKTSDDQTAYISKVEVDNFMGLNKVTVPLQHRVNLINGQNGSGKSTILCAIAVGLGGSARATDRGTACAEMVGNFRGLEKAVIKVHLRILDPILADRWGDQLVVERTLTRAGASAYRIERVEDGRKGRLLSNKKSVLDDLCRDLNYQVSPPNPVQILQQNDAREFFAKLDGAGKSLYRFFMRCTGLEGLFLKMEKVREQKKKLDGERERAQRALKTFMEGPYKVAKADFESHEGVRRALERKHELVVEYGWALAREAAQAVKLAEEAAEKARRRAAKAEEAICRVEGDRAEAVERRDELEARQRELDEQINQAQRREREAEDEAAATARRQADRDAEAAGRAAERVAAAREADNAEERAEEFEEKARLREPDAERARSAARSAAEKQEAARKVLAERRKELDAASAGLTSAQRRVDSIKQSLQALHRELAKRKEEAEAAKKSVEKRSNHERDLRSAAELAPEVETTLSSQELKQDLEKLDRKIKHMQKALGKSSEQVWKAWHLAQVDKVHKETVATLISGQATMHGSMLTMRIRKFKAMRKLKACIVRSKFCMYVKRRFHDGTLKWDHEGSKVEMLVQPEARTSCAATTGQSHDGQRALEEHDDTEGVAVSKLSGGERSYSMLCFILALSAESRSSLLALDEPDVFMDDYDRNHCLKMIVGMLRDRPNLQSIYISPLSMPDVGPDVHRVTMRKQDPNQESRSSLLALDE